MRRGPRRYGPRRRRESPQVVTWRREAREVKDTSKSYGSHMLAGAVFVLGFVTLAAVGYFNILMLFGLIMASGFAFVLFTTGKMPETAMNEALFSHRDKWRGDGGMLFDLNNRRRK